MADYMQQVFEMLMMQCGTVDSFNRFILPLMKVEAPELRHLAAEEASEEGTNRIGRKAATNDDL